MKQTNNTARRNFLTQVLTGWVVLSFLPALYGIVRYLMPSVVRDKLISNLDIGKMDDIPVDGAKIVRMDKKAIAVVRTGEGQVRAFSAVCTHLGCIVQYVPDKRVFHCNCHGSEFDLTGKNISGPAPAPLQPYRTELKGTDILISQI